MWRFGGSLADSRYRARADIPFTILPVAAPQWLARHPCRRWSRWLRRNGLFMSDYLRRYGGQ